MEPLRPNKTSNNTRSLRARWCRAFAGPRRERKVSWCALTAGIQYALSTKYSSPHCVGFKSELLHSKKEKSATCRNYEIFDDNPQLVIKF